jgi:hypothetical protein
MQEFINSMVVKHPRGGWIGESDQALWLQDSSVGKVNGNGSGPFVISWAFIIHNHQH